MPKLALLDGDGFLHRIAASMEKILHGVSWVSPHSLVTFGKFQNYRAARICAEEREGELWQRREIGTFDEAVARLRATVNETLASVECKDMLFIVSGTRNFRDQIGTIRKYKGNRDVTARPALLGQLREWAEREYVGLITTDNMEADDLISIIARDEKDTVVVSNDKDLKQVPGHHYNWVTKERVYINEVYARQVLYKQILTGDPGDNIVGCWGVGPEKASKVAAEWVEQNWGDEIIWVDMVDMFHNSRARSGCPYKDKDAEDVAEEMYKLVHLLEYYEEADDILRDMYKPQSQGLVCQNKNNRLKGLERIRNKNGSNQEKDTSQSAPSVEEAVKKDSGQSAPSATVSGT